MLAALDEKKRKLIEPTFSTSAASNKSGEYKAVPSMPPSGSIPPMPKLPSLSQKFPPVSIDLTKDD